MVGGSATVASVMMLRTSYNGPLASGIAGIILMGWVVGEILLLNQPVEPTWIEVAYFTTGGITALLAVVPGVRRRKQTPS